MSYIAVNSGHLTCAKIGCPGCGCGGWGPWSVPDLDASHIVQHSASTRSWLDVAQGQPAFYLSSVSSRLSSQVMIFRQHEGRATPFRLRGSNLRA
jgi:hypothetical protein